MIPSLFMAMLATQAADVSSSALSEAVEQVTHERAHMPPEIRLLAGGRFAGRAITMRLVRDESASGMAEGLKAIRLIEAAPPGSVVVAVLEDDKSFAVFGSTFAMLAETRKLAGFVVDGAVRDLAELRRIGLPTVARGTSPGSAGGHYRIEATNVPVRCGGVQVRPGDWVVGDEDGVSVAPAERLDEVLAAAAKWQHDKETLLPLIAKYGSYLKAMQARDGGGR